MTGAEGRSPVLFNIFPLGNGQLDCLYGTLC